MTGTESWRTKTVVMRGGMRLDIEPVFRDTVAPGSLIDAQNFETGKAGGYKRILGYSLYDSAEVPGTGNILGVFVHNDGVLAARGSSIYFSIGAGWGSDIAPSARTSAGFYRAEKYTWTSGQFITLVDGVNKPVRFSGTTGTDLAAAPVGADCVIEFKSYLCLGKGGALYLSDAEDDTTWPNVYPVGDHITGFGIWRERLYIFCRGSIYVLSGSSPTDFVISPVTHNVGCTLPDTIKDVGGDLVFLAADGLRTISSTQNETEVSINNFSLPIFTIFEDTVPDYHTAGRVSAVVVTGKAQYRLFFAKSTDASTAAPGINACLKNNSETGGRVWEFFKLKGIQAICADSGIVDDVDELIVHAGYDGYVWQQESGNSFGGNNINAYIQLPYWVFDDPAIRKIIYKLRLYVEVDGGAIAQITSNIYLDDSDGNIIQPNGIDMTTNIPPDVAVYNFGGSLYGTAVYGQQASSNYRTQVIGAGYNISIKLSSNDQLPAYAIKTAIMEYGLGARQ